MENDIDPPSFYEEEDDYFKMKPNNLDNNIITGIPIFESQIQNKNAKIEKNPSKNKISINAVDKKKSVTNNTPNINSNKMLLKDLEKPPAQNNPNANAFNSPSAGINISSNNVNKLRNVKSTEKKTSFALNNNTNNVKDSNPLNKIKNFEKNLTKNFEYNFEKEQDSDLEQDDLEDEKILHDPLTDKNQMINRCKALQDKLKEKAEQIKLLQSNLEETKKRQKEILDTIAKEQTTEIKDKKLIELAKKNQDFKLQIEKFKLKEKEYEKKISELNTEIHNLNIINLTSDKNGNISNNNETEANTGNNIIDLKKKLKTSEAKIADIRNKLQLSKEENSKLNILIKREIGENIDFEKALKDKTYWKGRSEIIESLKTKIKILESQIFSAGLNNLNPNNSTNNLSIISEEGKNSNSNSTTNNAINLNFNLQRNSNSNNKSIISTVNNPSLYQEYKREKERLNTEVEKLKEENSKITIDYNRVKLRKEALEKEVKQQKEDLTSKIKILLEKSDNDEKLILALNRELEKKGKGLFTNPNDENSLFNMQQEILKLRNDIKEKENFINNINTLMMGEGNNYNSGNRDQQSNLQNFSRIIIRLKELEDENKRLKQKSDDGKIYESLAKENAKLRLKVKELEDKLCER